MQYDIRHILLPIGGGRTMDAAVALGLAYARKFDAHLSTVFLGDDPNEMAAFAGEGLPGAMIDEMVQSAEYETQRRIVRSRLKFDTLLEAHGVPYVAPADADAALALPPQSSLTGASLEVLDGGAHEAVTWRARLCDVTVIPHLVNSNNPRASETLHAVLFTSGRPVIIAGPNAPVGAPGRRICIAWNGTEEAAVSLRAIIPWALEAEAVQILTSPDYQRRGPDAEQARTYLALHGVSATVRTFQPRERDVGKGLLAAVADFEADMMAMGAYSHSRLRQMILGGVTRHVLEHAPIPVMMSR
ncbi:universal stress protein [Brytella acorum]|uniref:Universal stress protein n=1 Tax=Brytella acorum TaxID=2959299 RepID=A0AA35UVX8_9PROT|nr:universal stress protein [Brytella acorum]MDF3624177.1 universal stress protein [Brytella acorum]CAI9120683.1 universal stress protein [Brytella acorum]